TGDAADRTRPEDRKGAVEARGGRGCSWQSTQVHHRPTVVLQRSRVCDRLWWRRWLAWTYHGARSPDREGSLALLYRASSGRARPRYLGRGFVDGRGSCSLDSTCSRSGPRSRLPEHGKSVAQLQRSDARRRQSVFELGCRTRREDGEISLALSDCPSRYLGLRRADAADPVRSDVCWPAAQSDRRAHEA